MSQSLPNSIFESIGVYLPPKAVSTSDLIDACKNTILYPIERLTGIKFRRMAGDTEFSIDLGRKAIESCLRNSKYRAEDIELVICCNISRHDGPDFHFSFEPSTSIRLKTQLGLTRALCFDISNACAGMFTGITLADAFLKAGMVRNALVVSGEYITHLTRTAMQEIEGKADNRMPCLTLGDSGAAVIMESASAPGEGFHDIDMFTLGKYSEYCIARPTYQQHGGAIMFTESVKLHAVAIKNSVIHVVQKLKSLKEQEAQRLKALPAGTPAKKAGNHYMIMHQTARTAIAETARQINALVQEELFNRDNMINNLEERGNTSSTSHIVAVWDSILNNTLQNGDSVLFAVQASGITVGTAPYTFDDLPDRLRRSELAKLPVTKVTASGPKRLASTQSRTRVRIESIGTVPAESTALARRDAFELASVAALDCFSHSALEHGDIDILMHAGVHRNEFICEPAVAALIAGRIDINSDIEPHTATNTTFAFDVFNGALGFLNACHNATALIGSGKYRKVMVVASEIENNADGNEGLLGLKETGSAVILEESEEGDERGFGQFFFNYFTEHMSSFSSHIGQHRGRNYLAFDRDPNLEHFYLDCISKTIKELLAREGLSLDQIRTIFPPQISSDFITRLSDRLNVARNRFVDLAQEGKDYFTSSLAYSIRAAQDQGRVKSGDVGLIINVGTGIQIGCATYRF